MERKIIEKRVGTMTLWRPDNSKEVSEIVKIPALAELQKLVGGYVEKLMIVSSSNKISYLFFDEDGMLKRLPFNRAASAYAGFDLVGNVLMFENVKE